MTHTYNEILLSYKKELNLVICSDVDEPRVIQREVRKKTSIVYYGYIWNLEKNSTDEPIFRTGIQMQI